MINKNLLLTILLSYIPLTIPAARITTEPATQSKTTSSSLSSSSSSSSKTESKENKEGKESKENNSDEIDLSEIKKYIKLRGAIVSVLAAVPVGDDETFSLRDLLSGLNDSLKHDKVLSLFLKKNETLEKYFNIKKLKQLLENVIKANFVSPKNVKDSFNIPELLALLDCNLEELPTYIELDKLSSHIANLLNGTEIEVETEGDASGSITMRPVTKENITSCIKLEKIRAKLSEKSYAKFLDLHKLLVSIVEEINKRETSIKKILKSLNAALIIPEIFKLIKMDPATIEKYFNIQKVHDVVDKMIDNQPIPDDNLTDIINDKALSDKFGIDIREIKKYVNFKRLAILLINKIAKIENSLQSKKAIFNIEAFERDYEIKPGLLDIIFSANFSNEPKPTAIEIAAQKERLKNRYRLRGFIEGGVIVTSAYALSLASKYISCASGMLFNTESVINSDQCPNILSADNSKTIGLLLLGGSLIAWDALRNPSKKNNIICSILINKPKNFALRACYTVGILNNETNLKESDSLLLKKEYKAGQSLKEYLELTEEQISKLSDKTLLTKALTNLGLLLPEEEFIRSLRRAQIELLGNIKFSE